MTINTKYDIGDAVYFLYKDSILKRLIIDINVSIYEDSYKIIYRMIDDEFKRNPDSISISEDNIFESKQALLEHLDKTIK